MKKAFTILELLVVVAIIAILAVVAVPQFLGAIDKARVSAQLSDLSSIGTAATMYNFEESDWPANLQDLTAVTDDNGPYIDKIPTANKWGGTISYLRMTSALEALAESPFLMGGRLTRDEAVVVGKQYFTRAGSGTLADPYILTPVASPIQTELSTYFELAGPQVLLKLTGVPADQAIKLDIAADSTDDHTEGTVRYTFPNADNKVDVYYILR